MGNVPDAVGDIATFASNRIPAWHGLGTVFTTPITDYREMLRTANMDNAGLHFREVSVEGVATDARNKPMLAVVRTSPFTKEPQVVGWVGERYEIVSNEDAFSFTQHFRKGGTWETAGEMNGGAVVFGSMALDREIILDPNGAADVVKSYSLVSTSHDGSTGIQVATTPVRVVCENTLRVALAGAKDVVKFRHTRTVQERMAAAIKAQEEQEKYLTAFEATANSLYAITLTKGHFFDLVCAVYEKPKADKKGALTRWENNVERIMALWNGPTNENLPDNGWKAANVLTENNQWNRGVRKNNSENFFAAGAGFDGPTNEFRTDVVQRVLALV